jgi:hypothetical protein
MKLNGQRIKEVRLMTAAELAAEEWDPARSHSRPVVIELESGDVLYASRDDEGNGPGALFGRSKDGKTFRVGAFRV